MSDSTNLNLANYTTVWDDNFATATSINSSIFPITWGNADDFSFGNGCLTLTSYASEGWSACGFIQPDGGASQSQGYGLYSATASVNPNQGVGVCICLWPSTNNWPGPELDMVEDWSDPTGHTGYFTVHWAGAGDSNQQDIHQFSLDLTQKHTFALDWEPNALTYYVDGQELFQVTGSEVPKDAADGGENEAFGAEVTAAGSGSQPGNSVSLHIYDISYSAYTPGSGGGSSGGGSTSGGSTSGGDTGSSGSGSGSSGGGTTSGGGGASTGTTIALSSPGTVQESKAGAGVNVQETVSAAGLSKIYWAVFTSGNVAEENWQTTTLDSSGNGSFTAHFEHSGDYIVAIDNTTNYSIEGWSTPITITDPSGSGSGSGTGSGSGSGGNSSGGGASGPTDVTVTGDSLSTTSAPLTVIGTLSATDSSAVTYTMGTDPGGLFTIDGNKLLLTQALPAGAPAGYAITVIATDANGGVTEQPFTLPVANTGSSGSGSSSAGSPGGAVTITDSTGARYALPIISSGSQVFTAAQTGLDGTVTETINPLRDRIVAKVPGMAMNVSDSQGGSYAAIDFATVTATLSGASSGSLVITSAQSANVTLGDGEYSVSDYGGTGSATFTAGSGTDRMVFIGTGKATFQAGSGHDLIIEGDGSNTVTCGTGAATIWGGAGADTYVYHAGDGVDHIRGFSAAKGDALDIDSSLHAGLRVDVIGSSTYLTFGDNTHGIVLTGVTSFNASQIHWA